MFPFTIHFLTLQLMGKRTVNNSAEAEPAHGVRLWLGSRKGLMTKLSQGLPGLCSAGTGRGADPFLSVFNRAGC